MAELLKSAETTGSAEEGTPSKLPQCIEALERITPRLGKVFKSQMREGPLTVQQMMMLREIHDEARPGELARRCGISSSATTAALDGLVRGGYCVRAHSETDRREVLVHITPSGIDALAVAQSNAKTAIREMLQGWDEGSMERLLTVLQDLENAANSYLAHQQGR